METVGQRGGGMLTHTAPRPLCPDADNTLIHCKRPAGIVAIDRLVPSLVVPKLLIPKPLKTSIHCVRGRCYERAWASRVRAREQARGKASIRLAQAPLLIGSIYFGPTRSTSPGLRG
jgi:hypothetical protein